MNPSPQPSSFLTVEAIRKAVKQLKNLNPNTTATSYTGTVGSLWGIRSIEDAPRNTPSYIMEIEEEVRKKFK